MPDANNQLPNAKPEMDTRAPKSRVLGHNEPPQGHCN